MPKHEHEWGNLQVPFYTLRRCKLCRVLARNSSGNLKVQLCATCKTTPATEWRLGSPYCEAHLPRPGNLKTLDEMSEKEIRKLEKFYGVPVRRPSKP